MEHPTAEVALYGVLSEDCKDTTAHPPCQKKKIIKKKNTWFMAVVATGKLLSIF